jgi:hypothetical protein
MPEPRDERVTNRPNPTKRRHRQQPADSPQHPVPLSPQDLRKGEVSAERLSPGDEIDASGGLRLGQPKLSHIRELPGDGLDRHRRPPHHEVRGGGAEPAVSVKDEDVHRCGHRSILPRQPLDFASRQPVQHLAGPHPQLGKVHQPV